MQNAAVTAQKLRLTWLFKAAEPLDSAKLFLDRLMAPDSDVLGVGNDHGSEFLLMMETRSSKSSTFQLNRFGSKANGEAVLVDLKINKWGVLIIKNN